MPESRQIRCAQAALYLVGFGMFFFGSHIHIALRWRRSLGALLLLFCALNLIYIFRQKHLEKEMLRQGIGSGDGR